MRVTYVEFEILGALARSPGRVLTRETLLEHVWGDSEYRDPRTVDVHIRHLREKIEREPKEPEFLFTVRGVGYRFESRCGGASSSTRFGERITLTAVGDLPRHAVVIYIYVFGISGAGTRHRPGQGPDRSPAA